MRRYGRVGGMETYVWELTHSLAKLGAQIHVICETVFDEPDGKISIHKIASSPPKPRWKSMLQFRNLVSEAINLTFTNLDVIIHSHERSLDHHVTTFHGPPMKSGSLSWLPLINRRTKAWFTMERDEIFGPNNQMVLPVSKFIQNQLLTLYPQMSKMESMIAYPGVSPSVHGESGNTQRADPQFKKFAFVGKEWKRKGLDIAIRIVEKFAESQHCSLDVYGPTIEDLPRGIRKHPLINCRFWMSEIPWNNYDALVHPARSEPFGMVVLEARSCGLPVLTTNVVGSTELELSGVIALPIDSDIETWTSALNELCANQKNLIPETPWTWEKLAELHVLEIYPTVISSLGTKKDSD